MQFWQEKKTGKLIALARKNVACLGVWMTVDEEGKITLVNESAAPDFYITGREGTTLLRNYAKASLLLSPEQMGRAITGHTKIVLDHHNPGSFWIEEVV